MRAVVYTPWATFGDWMRELRAQAPDIDFQVWPEVADPASIDVAMLWAPPRELVEAVPNIRAMLSLGAGVDHILRPELELPDVPLARLVDPVMARRMAEYVLYAVLRYHRQFDLYDRQQAAVRWEKHLHAEPHEITVGLLGIGSMGMGCAELLRAVGYRVIGWSRSRRDDLPFDGFAGRDELPAFLGASAMLVCLLPLTEATRGILDRERIAMLPDGAFIINVARGQHIVDADLLQALDEGKLGGAFLDVFHEEPLPADDPLWRHPKIDLTPHIASISNPATGAAILIEQLRRLQRGEPMNDLVEPSRGY